MGIGILSSNSGVSSIKFTGSPIASRFVTTDANQKLITLTSKDGKVLQANSVTISAGTSDLYFSVRSTDENIASYVWTNDPVFFCAADESVTISGLSISHIKFSNNSGAQYFIQALTY